ncbi:hypothetical protein C7455_109128 [Roseicyclus mahoneyensis]|jgi:hypothetical protein|uniref:Uncharacterized protein n=1 Tax=Roseicyclus mahoneyensis TaxID=164332 RepID=A0A316GG83_9RHOB|nr:hypothetical protein C7455_109128 [Roseicyclus mahoneyensis]
MCGKEWTQDEAHAACAGPVPMGPARCLLLSFNHGADHVGILRAPDAVAAPLALGYLDRHLSKLRANLPRIHAARPDHLEENLR